MRQRRPVALDLFAGAGGLTLGFEQAGFDILASVEYDAVHAAVHSFNFPLTETVCADIRQLSAPRLLDAARAGWARHGVETAWDEEIDVIFGGPPCQGFSFIGKRLVDDQRNQLVFHFFRMIDQLRPRYFVMENVPGMRAGGHSSILSALIREFEDAGYRILKPVSVLNAAEFGVPQDRQRLFLLGARDDQRLPHYPLPTCIPAPKKGVLSRQTQIMQALPPGPTVADAINDLPDLDEFDELLTTDEVRLRQRIVERMVRVASPYARKLRSLAQDTTDFSWPREWDDTFLTSSMRTEHTALSISRFAATEPGNTEPVSRFYRLDRNGLCNTLRAGTGSERGAYTSPRPIHPTLSRVISVREAARLHSIPDWFRLHRTKWHGFRQIGNSVPPLLGRAVAEEVLRALDVRPTKPLNRIPLGDSSLLGLTMSLSADLFGADRSQMPPPRQRECEKPVLATRHHRR